MAAGIRRRVAEAVIGTINRYSPREMVITDKGLNDLRFTGTVSRDRRRVARLPSPPGRVRGRRETPRGMKR